MRLGFTIGRTQVTIIDTEDSYDFSSCSDDDLNEMVEPCLSKEKKWDPVAQAAYAERFHRQLVDEGYYD